MALRGGVEQAAAFESGVAVYVARPWMTAEIAFESERDYPRPFLDVDVLVTFSGPGGELVRRPAFWDGR